ncbi:hypothetical protein [Euzebya sp.]|uniref:hypothetical protein n=1 Tax=Euzebya sp. TaxID=1971409 RepID=UPI00351365CD
MKQPRERGTRRRGLSAVGVIVTLAVAAIVATGAGYVIDGAGRLVYGFWAVTWGLGTVVLGLAATSAVARWRAAPLLAVALAVAATIAGAGVLVFTGPFQVPLTSPEGLWMYPAALALFGTAGAAVRVLLRRGSGGDHDVRGSR